MKLAVHQYGAQIGMLESTPDRGIVFRYDLEYARKTTAAPISQSLPIRDKEYSQAAAMPFFAGLLPDGDLRRRVAEGLHVSETSSLKLLEALGGECAGTISLIPEDEHRIPTDAWEYDEIPLSELERLILESERIPMLISKGKARLSLAGGQEKVPLLYKDGRWFKPKSSAPTTHIIKPASSVFPGMVYNEYAAMSLAGFLSIPVPRIDLRSIGKPILIIERYDRYYDPAGELQRLHQEDCCQALGILPERKYQSDGGPGYAQIAELVRRVCWSPLSDLEKLIDSILFNLLIGNCDAHGKNYSLLYSPPHEGACSISLAPFYDLLATTYWPELERSLSMKVGRTYTLARVGPEDLDYLASDLGVGSKLMHTRLDRLIETAPKAWDLVGEASVLRSQGSLIESIRAGWQERAHQLRAPRRTR